MSDDSNVYLVLMNMPDEWGVKHLSFEVQGEPIPDTKKCVCYKLSEPLVQIDHATKANLSDTSMKVTDVNTVIVTCTGEQVTGDIPPTPPVCVITLFKEHTISLSLNITTSTALHFKLSPESPDPVGCGE